MEEQWRRRKVRGDEAEQRGEGESPSLQQLLHCLARQEAPAAGGGSWRKRVGRPWRREARSTSW